MQLTKFSDYALRVLMFAHAAGDRLVTIDEMAASYRISAAHLMKVVNALTRAGYKPRAALARAFVKFVEALHVIFTEALPVTDRP